MIQREQMANCALFVGRQHPIGNEFSRLWNDAPASNPNADVAEDLVNLPSAVRHKLELVLTLAKRNRVVAEVEGQRSLDVRRRPAEGMQHRNLETREMVGLEQLHRRPGANRFGDCHCERFTPRGERSHGLSKRR